MGEGAAPSPQMHSRNMLRDSPSVRRIFGGLVFTPFCRFAEKHLVPLDSYLFWVLRFIYLLGP